MGVFTYVSPIVAVDAFGIAKESTGVKGSLPRRLLIQRKCPLRSATYMLGTHRRYRDRLRDDGLGSSGGRCFMEEVKEHPYVLGCEAAKPLIVDTFKFMYDLDFLNPQADELTTPPLAMPRLPHEVIFAIGGWSGGTSKGCIETYDTRADRWVTINAEVPAGPRAYHGTAVLGFKIFSIGGYDGVEYFNTCRVFDTVKKKWNEIAPMHCRRCYVSVTELKKLLAFVSIGYNASL
ncbi:kelch-like protein 10 [Drosophila sechellia]|uniref:kelch-like protein 10 n=1 Tax=Drosophila sechellia TaxID=7238 RepID=UPI0013DE3FBB|nr:kelch-like protein 10 [Drosophila sechellia]